MKNCSLPWLEGEVRRQLHHQVCMVDAMDILFTVVGASVIVGG